jgi:hypothetical protein
MRVHRATVDNARIDAIAIATNAVVEVETVIAMSAGAAKIEIVTVIATATSVSHAKRPKKRATINRLLSQLLVPKAVAVKAKVKGKDVVAGVMINAFASNATTIVASVNPPPLLPRLALTQRRWRRQRLHHQLSRHQHRLSLPPTQRSVLTSIKPATRRRHRALKAPLPPSARVALAVAVVAVAAVVVVDVIGMPAPQARWPSVATPPKTPSMTPLMRWKARSMTTSQRRGLHRANKWLCRFSRTHPQR